MEIPREFFEKRRNGKSRAWTSGNIFVAKNGEDLLPHELERLHFQNAHNGAAFGAGGNLKRAGRAHRFAQHRLKLGVQVGRGRCVEHLLEAGLRENVVRARRTAVLGGIVALERAENAVREILILFARRRLLGGLFLGAVLAKLLADHDERSRKEEDEQEDGGGNEQAGAGGRRMWGGGKRGGRLELR